MECGNQSQWCDLLIEMYNESCDFYYQMYIMLSCNFQQDGTSSIFSHAGKYIHVHGMHSVVILQKL
jgi:hypothetical protein